MEDRIKCLKNKLECIGTRDLLGMISIHFLTFAKDAKGIAEQSDIFGKTKLMSPQKQYIYLAGLLMSTEDKSSGCATRGDDSRVYEEFENDVQEITLNYIRTFLDVDPKSTREDIERNLVSMDAFVSYFDMGILRYPEQTIELFRMLYSGFDAELEGLTGLTTADYIAFYELVSDTFAEAMSVSQYAVNDIKRLLDSFNPFAVDVEKEYDRFMSFAHGDASTKLQNAMDNMNSIKAKDVVKTFGKEKGEKLLEIFGLYRKARDFQYYNGKNPFAEKPLSWIDNGETLFIVHPQFLLNAIFEYVTNILENPNNHFAEKYKKAKADIVENQFLKMLKSIFGERTIYHTSVCEERGTKEHDIVVEFENYILIIEVKASKVREPFFNPEKGYVRVKDHFNSDVGIGGAYEQAIILKRFIESKEEVILYENKKDRFEIHDISKKEILPIVFTLNQFGGLAINTSRLLEKDQHQPYPWVCNLHDLENIIEILNYLGKTPNDFIEYIIWRNQNHEKIIASDELDVIERYFFDEQIKVTKEWEYLFFPPNGPSLIDKIYYNKQGIPYDYTVTSTPSKKTPKIGRNEHCPCGSGKKFKKCCIGKGIYD